MNQDDRINFILKIAQENGILSKIVRESLNKKPDSVNFSMVGSVGPHTTLSVSDAAVKEDGSVNIIFMIRGLLPNKQKGQKYKPWQYAPGDLEFNGAVVTAEAGGVGSKENMAAFGSAAWLNRAAEQVLNKLQAKYPDKDLKIGNITLASFSGGGDAVASLLSQRNSIKYPIKNVIGIDTFHLTDTKSDRYKAVLDFMREAQKDPSKHIHLVHSAVPTGSYASTTQTADNLLKELGISRKKYDKEWVGYGPKPVSQAKEGGLVVTQLYDKAQPYMAKDPVTGKMKPNILGMTSGGQHLASLIWLPNAIKNLQ